MSDAAAAAPVAPPEIQKEVLGVTSGKMAMWIFLGSDGMSFMGLIATYIALRIGSLDTWPSPGEHLGITLASIITFLLICSSVTMVKAFEGAVENNVGKLKLYLGLTILGGVLFLCGQAYEYSHFIFNTHPNEAGEILRLKISGIYQVTQGADGAWLETLVPNTRSFGGTFFVLTSFHGCHVLSGVVYLSIVLIGVLRGRWTTNRIEIVGLYWHFVDLVWIVIFTIVYLVETKVPGA